MHVFSHGLCCACGVERPDEGAAFSVKLPGFAEVLALIAVRQGYGWNRVFDGRERRMEPLG